MDSDDSESFEVVVRPWTEQGLEKVKASCQMSHRHWQQHRQLLEQHQQETQMTLQRHHQEVLQLQAQQQEEWQVVQ
jgi:hypothetical protein